MGTGFALTLFCVFSEKKQHWSKIDLQFKGQIHLYSVVVLCACPQIQNCCSLIYSSY